MQPLKEYKSSTVRVRAPEGNVFLNIVEDDDKLARIDVFVGKAGTQAHAAAYSIVAAVRAALHSGAEIDSVAEELLGVTHEYSNGRPDFEASSLGDAIGQGLKRWIDEKSSDSRPS